MKKITEHKIEQFIRFPHELSSEEKGQIEKAIQDSDELKKIYHFFKDFYLEYERLSTGSKNVIALKPASFRSSGKSPLVLAAMTEQAPLSRLKTMATLVSEEAKSVVRVLEDQKDKSLQFHVLVQDTRQSERAILSLINPELDFVTDVEGKLKGIKELLDISWDDVHTLLRIPVFKKEVHPNDPHSFTLKEISDTDIRVKVNETRINVSFEVFPTQLTRVLWAQGKESELKRIDKSQLSFTIKRNEPGTLYFYE